MPVLLKEPQPIFEPFNHDLCIDVQVVRNLLKAINKINSNEKILSIIARHDCYLLQL